MNEQYPPTETTLGIGGLSLHFATWGQRTQLDRAVLLVHGLTVNHREFVVLGPALAAQGWYVVAPDLRGRGLSAKPTHGYGIAFHANDLLTLSDALGLTKVHIVGHSLGALIATYMAALYAPRIGKIVLVDAGGKIPDDSAQAIAASVNRLGMVYPSLDAYLDLMRQLPVLTWNPFWEQFFRYDANVHPDGTVTSRVPKSAIDEEVFALGATRTEALPPFVQAPTLILRAALGTLGPDKGFILTAEEAERLRSIIPNCQLIEVPGTNHYTIIEADLLQQSVLAFLAEAS